MPPVPVVHDDHRRREDVELPAGLLVVRDIEKMELDPLLPGDRLDPGQEVGVVGTLVAEIEELQVVWQ